MITVNGRFLAQRLRGAQRYAHEVTRRLIHARGGGGIRVLMPRHSESLPEEFGGVAKQVGRLRGHPWEQLELGRFADEGDGVLWSPIGVGPMGAKCHVPTIHDVFAVRFPGWVGRRFHLWYSFVLPRIASSARHIVTVSEYSKGGIVEALEVPEEKVSVVYLGVDPGFVIATADEIAATRRKYGLPQDFILTLGSLEPRKNLDRVVEAWSSLAADGRPPLVIAGGLGDRRVYGNYDADRLRRHKDIQLLGYVPDEDLSPLYSAATVFVYASLLEGFGLPPLEAMACGAAVVVSDTSAMSETHGGLAFLVDPGSVESIATEIEKALQTGRSPAEKEEQSRMVKERFDWSNTAKRTEEILHRYE